MTGKTSYTGDGAQFLAEIQQIAQKCAGVKSTLPFSLRESRRLLHLLIEDNSFLLTSPQLLFSCNFTY